MKLENYYKIPTFDEAMAIVESEKGFSHSVQELNGKEIHSFKYNLSYPEMWDSLEDGRINLRGLTYIDGKIVALPYPKFFNMNENRHVQEKDIDLTKFIIACEKVDGSLISFFRVGDSIDLKTMKSVYSDTAIEAREFVKGRSDIIEFVTMCIDNGVSPIFEYISNTDTGRIVIDYDRKDLVFLGARNMESGVIYTINTLPVMIPDTITKVKEFSTNDEIKKHMAIEGVEGVVMVLSTGLMIKCKTDWYCRIHRLMDLFSVKNIIESIVNDEIDDTISILTKNGLLDHVNTIRNVIDKFHKIYHSVYDNAVREYNTRIHLGQSKKDIAMSLMKENKELASLVFALYDEKDISSLIKAIVKRKLIDSDLSCYSV